MVKDRMDDPQKSSRERKHEHVEAVNDILDSVDPALEKHAYPTDPEELSARYGETPVELPNETETLGDVFDRLADDEYGSPRDVREAVLNEVGGAAIDPNVVGNERESEPGTGGAPEPVGDDLESDEPSGTTEGDVPTDAERGADDVERGADDVERRANDIERGAGDVGTAADTVDGPEADSAEPGDELTSDTTEPDEFAPQETLEDRDREGDRRASADRSSDRGDPWEEATDEPGDPAEPTAEPTKEELDPAERGTDVPDARANDEADENRTTDADEASEE